MLDYNHDKYITTQELNKLATDNIAARLKQTNSATKSDTDEKDKVTLNKTKQVEVKKKPTDITI